MRDIRDMRDRVLAGIFVGGRSSRMGTTKGLLSAPNDPRSLVQRTAAIFAAIDVPVVLVGEHEDFASLGWRTLPDAVKGIGPLGGLVSLLEAAGDGYAIACACDLPYVDEAIARRLLEAEHARALTPLAGGVLQPLFARFDARACAPIARRRAEEATRGGPRALQGLLKELGATPLALTSAEEALLDDWDTPEDMLRGRA